MKTGIELIAQERQEQIEKHGRTVEKDKEQNDQHQLSLAASYLIDGITALPKGWNALIWKKMVQKPYKERLVIAGALIAAEIDRITP